MLADKQFWLAALRWLLRGLALLLVAVTLLGLTLSNEWWVRLWDFPRVQIVTLMLIVLGLVIWLDRRWRWWLAVPLAAACAWQFHRILPYTPLAPVEVAMAPDLPADDPRCFTLLSFNVLQDNRDFGRTARMIDAVDPDILLLTETDTAWIDALAPQLSRYPHRLDRPLDNTYGMAFATRLPMAAGRIEEIAEEDTPSVDVQLAAGAPFRLIGVHPHPPQPGRDTEERDAEIAIAATRAARDPMPVLVTGDFNDVAWSDTSLLFKRIGGYLDPRVGRGTYATFPSRVRWLAWPLDHVYFTPEFTLRRLDVLDNVGSDHRPLFAELCLTPQLAAARNAAPERADRGDVETRNEVIEEYREDQAEEARGED